MLDMAFPAQTLVCSQGGRAPLTLFATIKQRTIIPDLNLPERVPGTTKGKEEQ